MLASSPTALSSHSSISASSYVMLGYNNGSGQADIGVDQMGPLLDPSGCSNVRHLAKSMDIHAEEGNILALCNGSQLLYLEW